MKRILSSILAIAVTCASTTGCGTPQTIAALIASVGATAEQLASARGDTTAAQAIHVATANASTAAANWKSGSGTEEVAIQLFGDLQSLALAEINALDPNSPLQLYATIISAGLAGVIALLPQDVVASPAFTAHVKSVPSTRQPLMSQKDYAAAWRAQLKATPVASLAPIK